MMQATNCHKNRIRHRSHVVRRRALAQPKKSQSRISPSLTPWATGTEALFEAIAEDENISQVALPGLDLSRVLEPLCSMLQMSSNRLLELHVPRCNIGDQAAHPLEEPLGPPGFFNPARTERVWRNLARRSRGAASPAST